MLVKDLVGESLKQLEEVSPVFGEVKDSHRASKE
jgi:hypothetical protein